MNEQQSNSLCIQMPLEERKRVTTVIANWQFSAFNEDAHTIKLFLLSNEAYIMNLINKKEIPMIKDEYKGKIPENTILHQPFTCFFQKGDGKQDEPIPCDGEVIIIHLKYQGLKFLLKFNNYILQDGDFLLAKFLLWEGYGVDPHNKSLRFQKEEQGWVCFLDEKDFSTFLKNRLALQILFQRELQRDQKFVGIKNNGSTCYMNSILQILYFMRPLRKSIIDYKGSGKTILALRDIFLSLMHEPQGSKRPIDAQDLIRAYGRFSEEPRRQQDTHQFLLGFLQELEGECPTLAQLWQGQGRQILKSLEEDKPYRSDVRQDFNGLDLPLQDDKGNTFAELIASLRYLLVKEQVEDKIQTDDYGKVSVTKNRQFLHLPPILFLTLKRYEFKKNSTRPNKILADLHYPSSINLGFLLDTPTGEDMEYELFAVTVHKGQHYCSGHYYSFVNTSSQEGSPLWLKFDDSRVFLSSVAEVESFTGGKKKTMSWNKEFDRFLQKQYKAEDTAYILVYFKRQLFRQYQSNECTIPQEWINKKRKIIAHEHLNNEEELKLVQVAIMDTNTDFDIYGEAPTIPIGLKPKEDIVNQLKKIDYNLLGCKVGTVWKVSKSESKPKIKRLIQYSDLPQTPNRVFDPKRGHRRVDYLLVIPQNVTSFSSITSMLGSDKLGLVRVTTMSQSTFTVYWKLIRKDSLQDFISEEQKKSGKKVGMQIFEKQQFEMDWNDSLGIVIE